MHLYLIAEFFYSKDEKQKSKEFFNQILDITKCKSRYKNRITKKTNTEILVNKY